MSRLVFSLEAVIVLLILAGTGLAVWNGVTPVDLSAPG